MRGVARRAGRLVLLAFAAAALAAGLVPFGASAAPSPEEPEPEVTVTQPEPGATVKGVINIVGNAVHPDIRRYEVLHAPGPKPTESSDWVSIGVANGVQVNQGTLTTWDTSTVPEGVYTLALSMWWGEGEQETTFVEEITVERAASVGQLRPPAEPGQPVNLSQSGAASDLSVVEGPGGQLQVFWQDQFDGLTTAYYNGQAWTQPESALIMKPVEELITYPDRLGTSSADRIVERRITFEPVAAAPRIHGGPLGRAHALWREPREEAPPALMHSALALGSTTWSTPAPVQDTALMTDTAVGWDMAFGSAAVIHLAYFRTHHTDLYPAGIYYRRSVDGGMTWSAPSVLYDSIYVRLRNEEDAHVRIATGAGARLHVVWDDPRADKAFYVRSLDGGASWTDPVEMGTEEGARRPRIVTGPEGQLTVFWRTPAEDGSCALYQRRSPDAGESWEEPDQILQDLTVCPEEMAFLRTAEGQLVWVGRTEQRGLALAAWNGERWSELSFEHPELEEPVDLTAIQPLLLEGQLAVIGAGPYGDIWSTRSDVDAFAWAFAPPPPWSDPETVSEGQNATPGLPATAVDSEGRLHLLWATTTAEGLAAPALTYTRLEGDRWSRPADVLRSPDGTAKDPALAASSDRLHAVWADPDRGTALHSRAYVRDAYAAGGWSEPAELPGPGVTASSPDIVVDANGALHVLYAVPLNQQRGVYMTSSRDDGATWSDAATIFDAEGAGWAMADHAALAMGPDGALHAVWSRGAAGGPFPPQGIVYARSTDGGTTWSEPRTMAEGAYGWPAVAAPLAGRVHLLWGDAAAAGSWTHRRSTDGGATWEVLQQVPGLRDVAGPLGLSADGAGTLHVLGLGRAEAGSAALHYVTWDAEAGRWQAQEPHPLPIEGGVLDGVAAAVAGPQGRLDVAFRAEAQPQDEEREPASDRPGEDRMLALFHTRREVPVVEERPEPAYTPQPTATPTPGPTSTPTPTPRPTVVPEAPEPTPPTVGMGPLSLPAMALVGVVFAVALVIAVIVRRSRRGRP